MKVLRRSGEITDLDVIFGTSLQETLKATAGMFRALAFIAVRQEQNDPARPLPFRFRRDDKLIDNGLGTVGKITKLRFPKAQHVWVIERVTVIETEHRRFRKKTVVNANACLLFGQMHERNIWVPRFGVIKNGVPSAKGSARTVLTR